jgi:hypothetical protein
MIKQVGLVTFLTCTSEVFGLDISQDTDHPDEGISWFFLVHPSKR